MPKTRPATAKKASPPKRTGAKAASPAAGKKSGGVKSAASKGKSASKPAATKKPAVKTAAGPKGAAATKSAGGGKGGTKPAAASAKSGAKPSAAPKTPSKPVEAIKPAATPAAAAPAERPGRKGITIVQPKPVKKPEKASTLQIPKFGAPLLKPGSKPKPIIESGPDAARKPLQIDDGSKPRKTPFDKKALERFRQILVKKRADLIGDVSAMESEALKGSSGSLSHTPQHMAEQGTETFDQALSLDLAAADRRLIREIDDALKRIDDGTYGVCELTGKPIKLERLEELPWARHSIEAARELERRATMPQVP